MKDKIKKTDLNWFLCSFILIEFALYNGIKSFTHAGMLAVIILAGVHVLDRDRYINTVSILMIISFIAFSFGRNNLIVLCLITIIRICYLLILAWFTKKYINEVIDSKLVGLCVINTLVFIIAALSDFGKNIAVIMIWIYNFYLLYYLFFVIKPLLISE